MKSIAQLVENLRNIPSAMWEQSVDPFRRPHYPPGHADTLNVPDSSGVFVDGGLTEYPPGVQQELLDEKNRLMASEGAQAGIDALAWYVSFHIDPGWGIYIPTSSLIYFELEHLKRVKVTSARKREIALALLLEHELFHFAADYTFAQWEILLQTPCWRTLTERRRQKENRYVEIEEALANAHMLRTLEPRWPKSVRGAVRSFILQQPAGYDRAAEYVSNSTFEHGLTELAKIYVGLHAAERGLNVFSTSFDYTVAFPVNPAILRLECPIHIIHDLTRFQLPEIDVRVLPCIPRIVESKRFQKLIGRMPLQVQKQWRKQADGLATRPPHPRQFEKLRGSLAGLYSVRLNEGYRAHLLPSSDFSVWEAVFIGTHTDAGHD